VDQFTCRGSGYVLVQIKKLKIVFVPFQPFAAGSSYIPTPAWLANKHAVINVKKLSRLPMLQMGYLEHNVPS